MFLRNAVFNTDEKKKPFRAFSLQTPELQPITELLK
jgi:hypothetical protein